MMNLTNTVRETEGPGTGADFSAPLMGVTAGRLEFGRGASHVVVRGEAGLTDLFRAHFEGPVPEVRVAGGTVGIRYHSLSPAEWARWALQSARHSADITLSASVPWHLEVRGGVSRLEADLAGVRVSGVEVRGGASHVDLVLGRPDAIVPVLVRGGASHVTIWRPADVPVRASVRGGISKLALDDQQFGAIGGETRLHTGGWQEATAGYDVTILGGASHLTVGTR
jgi:hypothetical protein